MKNFLYITLLLAFYISFTYPVITQLDFLTCKQRPDIFLYSDVHKWPRPQEDEDQFNALKGFLESCVTRNERVHILIESPTVNIRCHSKPPKNILWQLENEVNSLGSSISIESIDLRLHTEAAGIILNSKKDPYVIPDQARCETRRGTLFIKSLMFKDLEDEMLFMIDTIRSHSLYKGDERVRYLAEGYIEKAQCTFASIKERLTRSNISLELSILETARFIYKEDLTSDKTIWKTFSKKLDQDLTFWVVGRLLEVYIFLKAIEHNAVDKILIIAGAAHTYEIKFNMLMPYGYLLLLGSIGKDHNGLNKPTAIAPRDLNPVIPLPWYQSLCTIV